jgi:hypothetical protein
MDVPFDDTIRVTVDDQTLESGELELLLPSALGPILDGCAVEV